MNTTYLKANIDKQKIKEIMLTQGLNASVLAERMKMSRQQVYNMLNYKKTKQFSTIKRLADALGVNSQDIIE